MLTAIFFRSLQTCTVWLLKPKESSTALNALYLYEADKTEREWRRLPSRVWTHLETVTIRPYTRARAFVKHHLKSFPNP